MKYVRARQCQAEPNLNRAKQPMQIDSRANLRTQNREKNLSELRIESILLHYTPEEEDSNRPKYSWLASHTPPVFTENKNPTTVINILNFLDFSKLCTRLLVNPKARGSRKLFLPENDFKTYSAKLLMPA